MGIAGVNPRKIIVAQFSKICNTILVKDTDGNYPDNSDEILPHAIVRLGRCMAINRRCGLEIHRLLVGAAPAHWSIEDRTSAGAERKQL